MRCLILGLVVTFAGLVRAEQPDALVEYVTDDGKGGWIGTPSVR